MGIDVGDNCGGKKGFTNSMAPGIPEQVCLVRSFQRLLLPDPSRRGGEDRTKEEGCRRQGLAPRRLPRGAGAVGLLALGEWSHRWFGGD